MAVECEKEESPVWGKASKYGCTQNRSPRTGPPSLGCEEGAADFQAAGIGNPRPRLTGLLHVVP